MNIKKVTLRTPTLPQLTIGRLYTHQIDKFKLLLGPLDLDILNTRTSAFAYFTVLDGVFYASKTGHDLLQAIVEQDDLICQQLQFGKDICNFLHAIWSQNIELLAGDETGTLTTDVFAIMAEHISTWNSACEYFDDNYNQSLIWRYLTDYEYVSGDNLDILSEDEVEDIADRVDAWESDRYIAITRMAKHYFTIAMKLHNQRADAYDAGTAFATFMDYYDKLREES